MTASDRFDANLSVELTDLASPAYADYLDDILQVTARTSQRPAWSFPERWLPMTALADRLRLVPVGSLRPVAILLILALLLVAAAAVFIGSQQPRLAPFGLASNGQVAFVDSGDVWVYDPATNTPRALVTGPEVFTIPAFSLDGTQLALLRGDGHIFVVNADGGNLRQLTSDALLEPDQLRWSPDGRSIAIGHVRRGVGVISIVRVGGSPRLTTLELGMEATAPAWRPPDGRQLLFRGVSADGKANLYVANSDGSGVTSLGLPSPGLDSDTLNFLGASWSPDGSKILYGGLEFIDADGIRRFRSHIVTADGTGDRMIEAPADLSDVWPVWSPDGRFFHFERVRGDYLAGGAQVWLVIAATDGSSLVEATEVTDADGISAIWSPDGRRLLAHYAFNDRVYWIDPVTGATEQQTWLPSHEFTWQRR